MRIIVTGGDGQVGKEFKKLGETNPAIQVLSKNEFDIRDPGSIKVYFKKHAVDAVINLAAFTDTVSAETNRAEALRVNFHGVVNLVEKLNKVGYTDGRYTGLPTLIHISTDYVFGPDSTQEIQADCKDFDPQTVYGLSKLLGELYVPRYEGSWVIVRTSKVFGGHRSHPYRLLQTLRKDGTIRTPTNVISSIAYAKQLAASILSLTKIEENGGNFPNKATINMVNQGYCSLYEWSKYLQGKVGFEGEIVPFEITKEELKGRPMSSRLRTDTEVEGLELMPTWQRATEEFAPEMKTW